MNDEIITQPTPLVPEIKRPWVWALVAGIVLIFLLIMGLVMVRGATLLHLLQDQAFARGLITFLVSLATIALGFILVVSALFGATNDNQFRRAREVFMALMGILGTIVGFYFGTATQALPDLKVSDIQVFEVKDGVKRLTSFANGGLPPYEYTVKFDDGKVPPITEKTSTDGWIIEEFESQQPVGISIEVKDRKGRRSTVKRKAKSLKEPGA
jgi:hypothetical protein